MSMAAAAAIVESSSDDDDNGQSECLPPVKTTSLQRLDALDVVVNFLTRPAAALTLRALQASKATSSRSRAAAAAGDDLTAATDCAISCHQHQELSIHRLTRTHTDHLTDRVHVY